MSKTFTGKEILTHLGVDEFGNPIEEQTQQADAEHRTFDLGTREVVTKLHELGIRQRVSCILRAVITEDEINELVTVIHANTEVDNMNHLPCGIGEAICRGRDRIVSALISLLGERA